MNIANPTLSNKASPCTQDHQKRAHLITAVVVVCWGALIVYLAATGAMWNAPDTPPLPLIYANGVPLGVFAVLYIFCRPVNDYVQTLDLSLLAGLHATRTIGFSFLVLASMGELPWLFAIPAGVGDIATALTAPFIAYMAVTHSGFFKSTRFLAWNIFGVIDFLVAIGTGTLSRHLGPELIGAGMEPMSDLPLMIIPAFLVPMLMITHIIMILRAVQGRKKAA